MSHLIRIYAVCKFGLFSSLEFSPVALRKAKIAYNFGPSECNRVKALMTLFQILLLFRAEDSSYKNL